METFCKVLPRFAMGLPRKADLRYNGAGVSAYMTEKRGRKG